MRTAVSSILKIHTSLFDIVSGKAAVSCGLCPFIWSSDILGCGRNHKQQDHQPWVTTTLMCMTATVIEWQPPQSRRKHAVRTKVFQLCGWLYSEHLLAIRASANWHFYLSMSQACMATCASQHDARMTWTYIGSRFYIWSWRLRLWCLISIQSWWARYSKLGQLQCSWRSGAHISCMSIHKVSSICRYSLYTIMQACTYTKSYGQPIGL